MKLTITIDDDVVRRARIKALEQGTSVDAIVRSFLDDNVVVYALEARDPRRRSAAIAIQQHGPDLGGAVTENPFS